MDTEPYTPAINAYAQSVYRQRGVAAACRVPRHPSREAMVTSYADLLSRRCAPTEIAADVLTAKADELVRGLETQCGAAYPGAPLGGGGNYDAWPL